MLATSLSGCSALCRNERVYAVELSSNSTLDLTHAPGEEPVGLYLRGSAGTSVGGTEFTAVYRVLTEGAGSSGILVSMMGVDPATREWVHLTLLLPTPLRPGDTYPIGRAFAVTPDPAAPGRWGERAPARSGEAEVALSTATETTPPLTYHVQFQAVSASGTVRVLERFPRSGYALGVDVTATGADGRVFHVAGKITAAGTHDKIPCA